MTLVSDHPASTAETKTNARQQQAVITAYLPAEAEQQTTPVLTETILQRLQTSRGASRSVTIGHQTDGGDSRSCLE